MPSGEQETREKAVSELVRATKKEAPIFVSAIERLPVCINSIVYLWPETLEAPEVFRKSTTNDYLG